MYKCEHFTDSIYYQIEQTAKYCRYLGFQIFQKLDVPITMDEFTALDTMQLHEYICQRELAKLILKDRPNTGRILNSLEEKGYIKRFADTKNNRLVRRMELTEEGKIILEKTANQLREYIGKLPKILSESDKSNLQNSLQRFRESLEKEVEMNI